LELNSIEDGSQSTPDVNEAVVTSPQPTTESKSIGDSMAQFVRERHAEASKSKTAPEPRQATAASTEDPPRADDKATANAVNQSAVADISKGKEPEGTKPRDIPYHAFKREKDKWSGRVDKLRTDLVSERTERTKAEKAVEILLKEVQELQGRVQIDPRDQQLKQLKMQQEVATFQQGLDSRIKSDLDSKFAQDSSEDQVQELADTLLATAREVSAKYEGVVTEFEILEAQRWNRELSADDIAKQLYDKRAKVFAQKHRPAAPRTTAPSKGRSVPASSPTSFDRGEDMIAFIKARKGIQ